MEEKKKIVKVCFFGDFSIKSEGGMLDEQTIHSRKILKLLSYFVMNRERMISGEELGEFLWGNGGSANPLGALKNLVYRLRMTLRELGTEEYIVSSAGAYGWNPIIPVSCDMEEFGQAAEKIRSIPEEQVEERITAYEEALFIYRKPLTAVLSADSFFSVRFTFYHSSFMKLTGELCVLYDQTGDYKKIHQICAYGITCDEVNEDMHYWLIRSWIKMGDMENALKQYEVASQILHSRLGIRRSRRIQALYEEILKMDHNLEKATLEDVCSNIKEPELSGVFLCEYTVFREIYRLETRRASRGKIPEYLLLLTLEFHELEQVMEAARFLYHKKKAMEKLKTILMDQLRMGDVVARYSDEQYIVMLPWCTLEGVYKVINRIRCSYMKEINCVRVEIRAEMREVTADYDLPVRIQRKAGWENDSV